MKSLSLSVKTTIYGAILTVLTVFVIVFTVNVENAYANFCNTNCDVSCSVSSGNCTCELTDTTGYCECFGTDEDGNIELDAEFNEC